ncbi:MAG TPA: endolytic transglycosylase MltG [Patescibacteria group bacterium]|nr:endolytic transglycosylase MltG [Patescibacteria group bacterium]
MNERKKKSGFGRVVIALIFLVLIGFFAVKGFISFLQSPVADKQSLPGGKNGKQTAFVVNPGETVSDVAQNLEEKGIIRSALFFKMSAKDLGLEGINAGDFIISPAMSNSEIIEVFKGGSADVRVTLIEGWRVEQMARQLRESLKIDDVDFLETAGQYEGHLFPDTYFFHPDASVATIVQTLRDTFDRKYTTELQDKIKARGLTPEQGVILASIVEREGRSKEVRTEVASVLLKRFKMGMKLDADATVQYAKDSQKLKNRTLEKFWQPVLVSDYTGIISPYNTYLNNGFPPKPIANPSLMSLEAVANANSNTPYLYYYHDLAGNSYYAKTLEEHNANVAAHR